MWPGDLQVCMLYRLGGHATTHCPSREGSHSCQRACVAFWLCGGLATPSGARFVGLGQGIPTNEAHRTEHGPSMRRVLRHYGHCTEHGLSMRGVLRHFGHSGEVHLVGCELLVLVIVEPIQTQPHSWVVLVSSPALVVHLRQNGGFGLQQSCRFDGASGPRTSLRTQRRSGAGASTLGLPAVHRWWPRTHGC